jgi:DNA-binding response OmpR family regulator
MSANTKVMVILADEPEIRTQVLDLLQRIGVYPILVKDGAAALTLLDEEGLAPSLIILDLAVSGVDGFEILERVRKMPWMDGVPVLILTDKADPEAIRRGLDSGADAYVTKPYLVHSLVDRVRVLLAAGRRQLPRTRFYGRTSPLTETDETIPSDE